MTSSTYLRKIPEAQAEKRIIVDALALWKKVRGACFNRGGQTIFLKSN
jgi:hypothetical protein